MEKMLQFDAKKRITSQECLNHPFFDDASALMKNAQQDPTSFKSGR